MPAVLFHANPSSGLPIYRQLMEQVLLLAASGRLHAGDFLPSVRQVADELQVNPMTVSKAYSALEREGVVELVRGTGMRLLPVRAGGSVRDRMRELAPQLAEIAARARQLSLTPEEVLAALRPLLENP